MGPPQLHISTFTSQMLMMVSDLRSSQLVLNFFVHPSPSILAAADTYCIL